MPMNNSPQNRRAFLKTSGVAVAACLATGRVWGANDRIRAAFIGVGNRGKQLLPHAMAQPEIEIAAICDVKDAAREGAAGLAEEKGHKPRMVKDFREVLADPSVDLVCVATPDHWHAYITVEACKAGKDVYVEKPLCAGINEGLKMVEAARKYNRIVETGTWQRSMSHFLEAVAFIKSGKLGKLFHVRTFNYMFKPAAGEGNPPDSDPPPGIDWDMWLGPAPKRPYNPARAAYGSYRNYWDYGGGVMTDWGVHWIDIVQMSLGEAMPLAASSFGGKYWMQDNRDVPDTLLATFEYPGNVLVSFETRAGNDRSLGGQLQGITYYGSQGTMFLNRDGYRVIPEPKSDLQPVEVKAPLISETVRRQWTDFLECVRTRRRSASDVENCFRSTSSCILANAALRSGLRVTWDSKHFTTREEPPRAFLTRQYRAPWKLVV